MNNPDSTQTIRVSGLNDAQVKELNSSRIIWSNQEGQAVKGDGYPIKNNDIINASELQLFKPSDGEVAGNITVQDDVQYIWMN